MLPTLPGFGVTQGGSTPQSAGGSAQVPRNQNGQVTPDSSTPILSNSAGKYGVPLNILSGVFGQETNFGADSKTSSAGAIGFFQFLPSTARQYAYPLTNTPTIAQFQQQADAAAHYLSDLFKRYGSWDAAIQHYSGGGYGLAQVQAKSGTTVQSNEAQAGGISLPNPLGNIADLLTSLDFWKRLGEVVAGILLLAMGLRALTTGSTTTPGTVVRAVKRRV